MCAELRFHGLTVPAGIYAELAWAHAIAGDAEATRATVATMKMDGLMGMVRLSSGLRLFWN
jgi:hypothetical protein